MKNLGAPKKILRMQISRDRKTGKLYLSQKGNVEKVLTKFNMQKDKPMSTPLVTHFKLSLSLSPHSSDKIDKMSKIP